MYDQKLSKSVNKQSLISSKTFLRDGANQVAFFVHPDANKIEIKKAVETAFNVKVTDVNVVTRKPTERVRNRKVSRVPGWRKAYVTLASGEKIEFFEGV